jgi:hypothetical protein
LNASECGLNHQLSTRSFDGLFRGFGKRGALQTLIKRVIVRAVMVALNGRKAIRKGAEAICICSRRGFGSSIKNSLKA